MDRSQRELRQAAAKAFMESLEQLGQEFQLPIDEDVNKDNENLDPVVPAIPTNPAPFDQFLDNPLLEVPLSSDIPLPEQDSESVD